MYAISQSISPKTSSHGLINRYEQFDLNYSIKHIISQKYFVNTIHVNNETLELLFTTNHQHRFHFMNPNFIVISGLIHIIIQFVSQITTQTPKTAHKTVTDCTIGFHNFFTLRFQDLGPIKRQFKASTQPKTSTKLLNQE